MYKSDVIYNWNQVQCTCSASTSFHAFEESTYKYTALEDIKNCWLGDIGTKMQSLHFCLKQQLFHHQCKTRWKMDFWCSALPHLFLQTVSQKGKKVQFLFACAQIWKQVFSSSMKTFLQMLNVQVVPDKLHSQSSLPESGYITVPIRY